MKTENICLVVARTFARMYDLKYQPRFLSQGFSSGDGRSLSAGKALGMWLQNHRSVVSCRDHKLEWQLALFEMNRVVDLDVSHLLL